MPAASVSHFFNGPRVVANYSRAEIIDVTARGFAFRGFAFRGFTFRGFNVLECAFHSHLPHDLAAEIRI
jgi:hypothetical protein